MIRVFPAKTNCTPIDDMVYFDGPPLDYAGSDIVHVSCTFAWDRPKSEFLAKCWEAQGYRVTVGGPAYDDHGGEFVSGQYLAVGNVITSRGCNNKCWFCKTWRREGTIRELPIVDGYNILDSNLLQCSKEHIYAVFAMLDRQKRKAKFTGGLESLLLEDWHVEELCRLHTKPASIYLAYDTPDDYEPLVRAAKMLNEAGLNKSHVVSCYVLIGYPGDTIGDARQRLEDVKKLNLTPYAMIYAGEKKSWRPLWKKLQREYCRPTIIHSKAVKEKQLLWTEQ